MMLRSFLKAFAVVCLNIGLSHAYMVQFTGTLDDGSGNFSGWVSIDPSLAEFSSIGPDSAGMFSDRGCFLTSESVCVADGGNDPPFITDYAVHSPLGVHRPLSVDPTWADSSFRLNTRGTIGDAYRIERRQWQYSRDTDGVIEYLNQHDHIFLLDLSSPDNSLLRSVTDLSLAPNLVNGVFSFIFADISARYTCILGECVSFDVVEERLIGTLTSIFVVPEPSTFALLLFGLLIPTMRRLT